MKKILIGLFGLISLGLINFSTAGTYTTVSQFAINITNGSSPSYIELPAVSLDYSISNDSVSVTCTFSNLSSNFPTELSSYSTWQFIKRLKDFSGSYNNVLASRYVLNGTIGTSLSFHFTNTNYNPANGFNEYIGFSSFGFSPYSSFTVTNGRYSGTITCVYSGDSVIGVSTCPTCPTIDQNYCTSNNLCPSSSNSCSPSGSCTVNNKIDENILYTGSVSLNNSSYTNIFNYGTNGAGTYCVKLSSSSPQTLTFGFANGGTITPTNLYQLYNDQYGNWICLYGNKAYFNAKLNSSSNTVSYEVYKLTDLLNDDIPCSEGTGSSCDYSDYILIADITKNYCTNRYSDLIDEEDITSGYCETEFGLIDPINCPASGGTGDVNWSTFWVNNTQIQGASSIYLYLPDFLNWDYTYINTGSTLQIDVENEGDQEYIQNILDIQSYHPDKDQFAMSFSGFLTLLMPYIIITLFIIFVWKLIRRIFR